MADSEMTCDALRVVRIQDVVMDALDEVHRYHEAGHTSDEMRLMMDPWVHLCVSEWFAGDVKGGVEIRVDGVLAFPADTGGAPFVLAFKVA